MRTTMNHYHWMDRCFAYWLVLIVSLPLSAAAQTAPELVTDRPDFTESGVVVPSGSIQIESGVTWEQGDDDATIWSGPELLIRWGLSDRLELRLAAPDRVRIDSGGSGWSDAGLGVKLQLGPCSGWDVAAIASMSLPTGDRELSSDGYDPELLLAVGRDLNERWSFGSQVSASWETTGRDERELVGGLTAVLGHGISETTGAFFELAAELPSDGTWPVLLHHGYTFLLSPGVQLDLHAAAGLSNTAPDLLVGAGLSIRL